MLPLILLYPFVHMTLYLSLFLPYCQLSYSQQVSVVMFMAFLFAVDWLFKSCQWHSCWLAVWTHGSKSLLTIQLEGLKLSGSTSQSIKVILFNKQDYQRTNPCILFILYSTYLILYSTNIQSSKLFPRYLCTDVWKNNLKLSPQSHSALKTFSKHVL